MKSIFVASKIQNKEQSILNQQIYDLCLKAGFQVYLPQKELPVDSRATPLEVLEANETEIDKTDIVIVVFDRAGTGVAMEYERAHLKDKILVGFRTSSSLAQESLGNMMEGAWQRVSHKASSFNELSTILLSLKGT